VRDFGFEMMGVFPYSQEPGTPMGRMSGQTPEEVKQARVEELMLTQQQVAFARNENLVGSKVRALVDRVEPGKPGMRASARMCAARHQGQAPDIDSVIFVQSKDARPGEFIDVKLTDYQAYDLIGVHQLPANNALPVLANQ